MKNYYYYYIIFFFTLLEVQCQELLLVEKDTITRKASIEHILENNTLLLTPIAPELKQTAGAPKAYYSYFWEFGDGTYSKEKEPKHTYKSKGDYEVKLWVTNHYDSGKAPATRPKKVSVLQTENTYNVVASMEEDLELHTNRDPVPEEEMVLVMSYKNAKEYVTNGRLYLFYNERKYKNNNFELSDFRTYNNEYLATEEEAALGYAKEVNDNPILYSSLNTEDIGYQQEQDSTKTDLLKTIKESKEYYKGWHIFDFDAMNPSEERNLFFTLKTPPEMLKDTSAIISIRGVYVPDRNFKNHKVKEKEMEIVTSHDPNKMSSNGTILNYRFTKFKTLKYKIQFQNDGEGPAKTIRLETDIPEMLDTATLKVLDMYPKVEICPKEPVTYSCLDTTFTKTQAVFTFKNIYLPGTSQKGVKEKDSTKGFVKYSIKFGKDFHKKKTISKTAIIFDKNAPIITNRSTTRFLPGLSLGVKAGYNYFPELETSTSYFLGATLSPYKSYRWYWQVELLSSLHTFNTGGKVVEEVTGDPRADVFNVTKTTTTSSYTNTDIEVPILMRYNINDYIGVGAGLQAKVSALEKGEKEVLVEDFNRFQQLEDELIDSVSDKEDIQSSFSNIRPGLLLEVTGGFARIGPSIGARYIITPEKNDNYFQFYAIWKF